MFKEIVKEIEWGNAKITLKTGKIARQSDGAVMISMGDSVVLCTAVSNREAKPDASFFPLTVHYREMFYSAGKIPGGYIKREGKASDKETLTSRLIDRPIRPLFHEAFFNETQVICTVFSHDQNYSTDILAMIGASAALAISGVPFMDVIAAARVGYINGEYILNPSLDEMNESKLDLVVAGTESSVMMVESEASELSEDEMLSAVKFGHDKMQPIINLIKDFANEAGKPKWELPNLGIENLIQDIISEHNDNIIENYKILGKKERNSKLAEIHKIVLEKHQEQFGALKVYLAFEEVKSRIVRKDIIKNKKRIDNRTPETVRPIVCEAGFLPKTHGSSLFTRGETQALVVTTLGSNQDEQIVEGLSGETRQRFMLQYIFPPYSVGEASPMRAPGRRETGHGKLAWRALNPVLPSKAEFPYTMRVVSEITDCNGSSSMATVCGASMALMDAGVPIKSPVAGIAMGLVKEQDDYVILSDIIGDEDHLGDIDFKVAGTKDGITSLQMDVKVNGINFGIMQGALKQAKDGRLHILSKMSEAIKQHRSELSPYAPQIKQVKIDKEKIRELIGPGGKVIREICEVSGTKIDISEDGVVSIAAVGNESMQIALERIRAITYEPTVGDILAGSVVKIIEAGAFINIAGGKDGFLHISEICNERISDINSHLTVGQSVKVKVIGFDKGKVKLSIKALDSSTVNTHKTASSNEANQSEDLTDDSKKKLPELETSDNKQNHRYEKPFVKNFKPKKEAEVQDKPAVSERKYFN